MKKIFNTIWIVVVIAIVTAYITWAKGNREIKNIIPEAGVLLELKQLRDQGEHAKADELLERRLRYVSTLLTGKRSRHPFPPEEAVTLADRIDDYLASSTEKENTEPNIGQVSPEAAPNAAPDEPSM